jgi:hypothetical protein
MYWTIDRSTLGTIPISVTPSLHFGLPNQFDTTRSKEGCVGGTEIKKTIKALLLIKKLIY